MLNLNQIYNEDCLSGMKQIPDGSIDFIFTDLPYGITNNSWDVLIPLDELWNEYERIIKDNGCIALWSQSPVDKMLACSNLKLYRYEWIIEKTKVTGHLNAKKMPMKAHENVLTFYKKLPVYHPQMTTGHPPVHPYTKHTTDGSNYGKTKIGISGGGSTERYPRDVLEFSWDTQKSKIHSTQKPVAACEYFIRTYTDPGDVVLDTCAGSATTAVAAMHTGRAYICFEKDPEIYEAGIKRIVEEKWKCQKEGNR